jgi:acyl-CoA thioesterase FadM
MEALFDGVGGGYAALIMDRRVGFPAVRAECEYKAAVRYGDTLRIDVVIARIGTSSCEFEYRLNRKETGELLCVCKTICVYTDLASYTSRAFDEDVRARLQAHLMTE